MTIERPHHAADDRVGTPHVRPLSPEDCAALLARHHVGRIAWCLGNRVDLQPIGYVFDAGDLYGRTSEGSKLATIRHSPWVAFEVDEVDGPHDWRSVIAHGSFYTLDGERRAHALRLLRGTTPRAGLSGDPTPERDVVFHVAIDAMTGRAATSIAARAGG